MQYAFVFQNRLRKHESGKYQKSYKQKDVSQNILYLKKNAQNMVHKILYPPKSKK